MHEANRQKYSSISKIQSWATKILVLGSVPSSSSGINHFNHFWNLLQYLYIYTYIYLLLFPFMVRVLWSGNRTLMEVLCILWLTLLHWLSRVVRNEVCPSFFLPPFLSFSLCFTASEKKAENSVRMQLLKRKVGWSRICPLLNYPEELTFLNSKGHCSCREKTRKKMQLAHQAMKATFEVSFSILSPGRENYSLYFAKQTGGKQHMPLLTELQIKIDKSWRKKLLL